MKKTALLLGASGLVGNELLLKLLSNPLYDKVIVISRSSVGIQNHKLQEIIVVNLESIESISLGIEKVDDYYCALGTTIRKAKTRERFRKVDFNYVLAGARLAKRYGARKMAVISALGSSSKSFLFYNRVKGEMEEAVEDLNWDRLVIARPSFLIGERKEKRASEKIFIKLFSKIHFLLIGSLKKFKAVEASRVAEEVIVSVQESHPKKSVIYFP